ncbi:MAG: hypothetical protein JRN53_06735 [Nitrososphaerota archaeon]|jgi:hypothetical protein|nr:hypothetical protein [Nitrososphaerota archaeon]MDG7040354.1 hypothetical protein [Nitrososphaerota archaeon]MDG7042422.1 hypothetical protein [Nitrososphaerota archaeon]MDG7047259.1 hypothetical protein [Nitrososphaerota archaeon]
MKWFPVPLILIALGTIGLTLAFRQYYALSSAYLTPGYSVRFTGFWSSTLMSMVPLSIGLPALSLKAKEKNIVLVLLVIGCILLVMPIHQLLIYPFVRGYASLPNLVPSIDDMRVAFLSALGASLLIAAIISHALRVSFVNVRPFL